MPFVPSQMPQFIGGVVPFHIRTLPFGRAGLLVSAESTTALPLGAIATGTFAVATMSVAPEPLRYQATGMLDKEAPAN